MARPVLLEPPVRDWYCPSCKATDQTRESRPHQRMHTCPAIGYLTIPMLPAAMKARHVVREREDYIGKEDVYISPLGRPVMSVSTERPDGSNDLQVYAPTAHADYR